MKKYYNKLMTGICTVLGILLMFIVGGTMCLVVWTIEIYEAIRRLLRRI